MTLIGKQVSTYQPSVLIVEDEEGPREALKAVLSPYFNLYTVDSAEVASQVLTNQSIDMMTLDLKLPGKQGIELLEEIRQGGKNVEVIIITGYGTLQSAIEAIRLGISAYILKPFNVSDLLDVINQTLDRRQRVTSLQDALQAFVNLWTTGSDLTSVFRNIEVLLGAKHPELAQHVGRVNFYSSLLVEHLKLSHTDRQVIQLGAYLHDVGKIGLQDRLIGQQRPSTDEDTELYKCHPLIGERMMKSVPFPPEVGQIIRHHHERYDGSGYPDGLQGEEIPFPARLVGIANVFDNLVTGQSLQGPVAVPEAREYIRREAGKSLDPALSDLFAKVIW